MSQKIAELTTGEFRDLFNDLVSKIPSTYLENVIRETIKKIEEERKTEFDIGKRDHYDDHERFDKCKQNWEIWAANHKFISSVRAIWYWFWKAVVGAGAVSFWVYMKP